MSPKRKEICVEVRELIVKLRKEGNSLNFIAETVGLAKSTIQTILKNFSESKSIESKPRSGRPTKISPRVERYIKSTVDKNPKITAVEIRNTLETDYHITAHTETVRSVLREHGFDSRIPRKITFISEINRKKRLDFALQNVEKPTDFWKSVLFSDESKYNLFGCDGKQKVWRKANEELLPKNLIPTVKYGGGSVMVWGCMSANGVGKLRFVETNMDRFVYLDILKSSLQDSATMLGLSGAWYFQQDNDPRHTSHIVKEWLLYNVPKQLHSPPQSPDLNPIEHLWDELERRIRKKRYSNKQELKDALEREWNRITAETTKILWFL